MATPAPATPASALAYSDWLQMAAIASGLLGGSSFIGLIPEKYVAALAGLAGVFAALSQYLQSKGD
jgi:hypothetical protein